MDRTGGGTTSPRHCTIYCLQRWALQRSWRPGCPASQPQGDTLTQSLIHHLLCTSIYQHASQQHQPHHTILDIEGIRGSLLLGTGSKFSFSTVEESCETNPLLQRTVTQFSRQSPFNQKSTKNTLNIHLGDLLKNSQIYRKFYNSFTKNNLQWIYPFFSFSLSLYDIWVNTITRDIPVNLNFFFFTFTTQMQLLCFAML